MWGLLADIYRGMYNLLVKAKVYTSNKHLFIHPCGFIGKIIRRKSYQHITKHDEIVSSLV